MPWVRMRGYYGGLGMEDRWRREAWEGGYAQRRGYGGGRVYERRGWSRIKDEIERMECV